MPFVYSLTRAGTVQNSFVTVGERASIGTQHTSSGSTQYFLQQGTKDYKHIYIIVINRHKKVIVTSFDVF